MATGLDLRRHRGRYAIIGDVHNCVHTLGALLTELGGSLEHAPDDLTLVSVGDLHDKGPRSGAAPVLRWAIETHREGKLIVVDSNHGARLARMIASGKSPAEFQAGSTQETYQTLSEQPDADTLVPAAGALLGGAPVFVRLAGGLGGETVVAHAAVSERLLNAKTLSSAEVKYHLWSQEFRWTGSSSVVTGHVTVPTPTRTRERRADGGLSGPVMRIDTGVDEGGALTAYLPHEDRFVSVPTHPLDRVPTAAELIGA